MAGNVRQVEHGAQAGQKIVRWYDKRGRGFIERAEVVVAQPLTYAGYTKFVLDRYQGSGKVAPVRVQVQKRGVMFCGKVLDASAGRDDTDWFHVDCQLGQHWFPHEKVRLCSGDGRCVCEAPEGAESRAGAASAPLGAVPLGNTGTTTGEGR